MPRITSVDDIASINKLFDRLDRAERKLIEMQHTIAGHAHLLDQLDVFHAPLTSNNMVFTWTGDTVAHGKITWDAGWLQDKNASTSKLTPPLSSAPGGVHAITIPANATTGIAGLLPHTYYWMIWNKRQQQMTAQTDVTPQFQNFNSYVICQVFTGTVAQTGVAGGGGSLSGTELSGAKYKNF